MGSAVGYLMLDTTNFQQGFKSALSDLETFKSKTATTQDKLKGLGSAMNSVGSQLSKKVTLPLVGIATAATKMSADFNQSMSAVKAVSGATGEEFDLLKDKALDLGASTAFSSKEVADGMIEMAKAGWSTQQILDGMSGVLDAAAASGESLATVSTIVADAITGFGLTAADSTRVADLLAQSANAGTIDIADLGEAFKYAAPVAQAYGYSIEDVTTAITAMSTAGIKGSQAGTSLRTALLNMASPTNTVATAMEQLGVSITDSEGNMLPLKDLLDDMREGMSKYSQAEQIAIASNLAGKNAVSGLMAILNLTQEEYDAISESMYNSAGVADDTARTMQDNLAMAVEQLGGALETLAIRFGDVLTPMIQQFVGWLTGVIEKMGNFSPAVLKVIAVVGALAAALGPLLLIGAKVITTFANASAVIGGLQGVITLLTGPLGIVALALTAFAAAWATNFGGIRDTVTEVINTIKTLITNLWENDLYGFQTKLSLFYEAIKNGLTLAFEAVKAIVTAGLDVVEGLIKVFAGVLSLDFDLIIDGLKTLATGLINLIKSLFTSFKTFVTNTLSSIVDTVKEKVAAIISKVKEAISALFSLGSASGDSSSGKTTSSSKSKTKAAGSYAKGLTYVPYDGFPAILHKGERVLTKAEADNYNSGKSGATYSFTFNSPQELSPAEQTRQFKKTMNQILFNM